jgi:hypothetical protein
MNTTENTRYNSLDFWYKLIGSTLDQQIIHLSLIPIAVVGTSLNIMTLVLLRSKRFHLPFYKYLRVYTVISILICLFNATLFSSSSRDLLKFTNSKASMMFFCYICLPIVSSLYLYGTFLDIVLSIDRVASLSRRIHWFRYIKPKKLCSILATILLTMSISYWFLFKPVDMVVDLNETKRFSLHFYVQRDLNSFFKFYIFILLPYFVDITSIVAQTGLSILTIILIKKQTKKQHIIFNRKRNELIRLNSTTKKETACSIIKRNTEMQMRLTISVIILSTMSTLYIYLYLNSV